MPDGAAVLGRNTVIADARSKALPAPRRDSGVNGVGIVSGGCRAMLGQASPPRNRKASLRKGIEA